MAPPLGIAALAISVACGEVTEPQVDQWSADAVERFHVRNEMRIVGSSERSFGASHQATVPSSVLPAASTTASLFGDRGKTHVRLRKLKAANGDEITYAFLFDDFNRPPKRVLGFRNGRVQYEFTPLYKRAGKSWVRHSARAIVYDDSEKATVEYSTENERGVKPDATHTPSIAAHVLPGGSVAPENVALESVAQECGGDSELVGDQEGGCWSERQDNSIAYSIWVATVWVAYQAALLCPKDAVMGGDDCSKAAAAAAASLVAFNAYTASMDRLIECEWRQWIECNNGSTGTGSSSTPSTGGTTLSEIAKAVNEFIARAIASGTYWCNASGTYCVYQAPQV